MTLPRIRVATTAMGTCMRQLVQNRLCTKAIPFFPRARRRSYCCSIVEGIAARNAAAWDAFLGCSPKSSRWSFRRFCKIPFIPHRIDVIPCKRKGKSRQFLQLKPTPHAQSNCGAGRTTCPGRLLFVGVSRLQHSREAGGFGFSAFFGAGFFEAPMQADLLQSLFAVEFLLEPAESLFHGLSFL